VDGNGLKPAVQDWFKREVILKEQSGGLRLKNLAETAMLKFEQV